MAWVPAGFKPVVAAVVAEAFLKIVGKALKRRAHYLPAAAAFGARTPHVDFRELR